MANTLNSSISLTSLDFETLKESYKSYLRNQDLFKDYDFDGSNISVLLEMLAYNTFKNSFYLNMVFSEGFIDSAQLRSSLLSHSKELNYLPRSVRSAKANLTVDFEASAESQPYIIPKGSLFSTLIKSKSYVFSTPEVITVSSSNNSFSFTTDVYEGTYQKDAYIFLASSEIQRFKITNKNVDTRSVAVNVYEDGSEVGDPYTLATSLLDLNESSKVFFLQASETGHYEVVFGDNNLGRQPMLNSTIVLDYRISNGEAGNGAKSFSVDFDPTGTSELLDTPTAVTGDVGNNGRDYESNESIRYYAPRHFQVQERAITTSDYEVSLKTQFPEINAVSVYGGEELDPPQFGRVFISVDISDVSGLPESKKQEYTDFISRRSPLSIDAHFVEPENLFLGVVSTVRYNLNITTNSANRIKTLVTDAILTYRDDYLDDFSVVLRDSRFSDTIDGADQSIVSSITQVTPYKKLSPVTNTPQNIDVDFGIALLDTVPDKTTSYPTSDIRTVYSSTFRSGGSDVILEDDGNGIIRTVQQEGTDFKRVKDVGTVNYSTGLIKLVNFQLDSYDGSNLKIYVVPKDKDIVSEKNTIMTIEPAGIAITVESLRI